MITLMSLLFFSSSTLFQFHFQQCSLTHIRSHTMLPLSLSSSHTHTEQQRKTPTGLDLFLGMKNQSVFIFFFINNSVSQFGSQRRQLGWCPNSRQSQFLGIFFAFSTLIMSLTNSLFSIQCIYFYRYCFFIPVKPRNLYIKHIPCTFNFIHRAKQPARLMIKPNIQCFNASTLGL